MSDGFAASLQRHRTHLHKALQYAKKPHWLCKLPAHHTTGQDCQALGRKMSQHLRLAFLGNGRSPETLQSGHYGWQMPLELLGSEQPASAS